MHRLDIYGVTCSVLFEPCSNLSCMLVIVACSKLFLCSQPTQFLLLLTYQFLRNVVNSILFLSPLGILFFFTYTLLVSWLNSFPINRIQCFCYSRIIPLFSEKNPFIYLLFIAVASLLAHLRLLIADMKTCWYVISEASLLLPVSRPFVLAEGYFRLPYSFVLAVIQFVCSIKHYIWLPS